MPYATPVATARGAVDWAWRTWQRLQVSRRGMYSLERLHLFHDYQSSRSLAWSFVVCVLTPLPTLAYVVSLEAIPLQPPSAGLRANGTTLLRLWLYGIVFTFCLLFQAREMVPDLPLTARQSVVVATATSSAYVAIFVLVASLWRFPVPFGNVLGVTPFIGCLFLSLAMVVGPRRLREVKGLGRPMAIYAQMLGAQCALAFVYPLYSAAFTLLAPAHQFYFVLVLPMIKLAMKNVVARISAEMEDLVPEFALFTVELFNALYMVTCMQNAGSMATSLAIITLDVVSSYLSLRSVDETTSIVAELRAIQVDIKQRDLLAAVHKICHEGSVTAASRDAFSVVRLRTVERLQVHRTNSALIRSLEAVARTYEATTVEEATPRRRSSLSSMSSQSRRSLTSLFQKTPIQPMGGPIQATSRTASMPSMTTVVPSAALKMTTTTTTTTSSTPSPPLSRTPSVVSILTPDQKRALVEQTLRALFQCEYLVLTEYIECAMPVVYAVYTAVLAQLPNHQFFPHTRNMTPHTLRATLSMVLGYAALEALSLVVLHALLRRKLRVSVLHQLAFVLETQHALIQGKMLVWAPFILQFTLAHCGVDFTFHFRFE